jgi:uncharacterized membrane protein YfcA
VLLAVGVAALLASFLAATAGFGGAVVLLPVLVWAFGVRDAVPILTVVQVVGNGSRVVFNRRDLVWPAGRWLVCARRGTAGRAGRTALRYRAGSIPHPREGLGWREGDPVTGSP